MATIAKKVVSESGVRFEWTDGKVTEYDVNTLPREMLVRAAAHGIGQKLGDSYAGAAGKGMTIAECRAGVADIWDNVAEGNWNMSGGSSSILIEALSRLTAQTESDVRELLKGLDDETKKEMEKRPDVKSAMADIRAERAKARVTTADVDSSDLLELFIKA